jgi:hypothetical protein
MMNQERCERKWGAEYAIPESVGTEKNSGQKASWCGSPK